MKKSFLFGALGAVLLMVCGCNTVKSVPDSWKENYPLLGISEVIPTDIDKTQLFENIRSWFLDNYTNVANKMSTNSDSTMMTIHITDNFKWQTITEDLDYTIVIEFRDGRIRFSTRDVTLYAYNGYGQAFPMTHDQGIVTGMEEFRRLGAELYAEDIDKLLDAMNSLASGTMEGADW